METTSVTFEMFKYNIFSNTHHEKFMSIDIYIDDVVDNELQKLYIKSSGNHNKKIFEDPHFYDAGFDLFLPKNDDQTEVNAHGDGIRFFGNDSINKVNFKVKCFSD